MLSTMAFCRLSMADSLRVVDNIATSVTTHTCARRSLLNFYIRLFGGWLSLFQSLPSGSVVLVHRGKLEKGNG